MNRLAVIADEDIDNRPSFENFTVLHNRQHRDKSAGLLHVHLRRVRRHQQQVRSSLAFRNEHLRVFWMCIHELDVLTSAGRNSAEFSNF